MADKYKLNELETDNITRIKQDDIKKMIIIVHRVCTLVHNDGEIDFPTDDFINKINSFTAYRKLLNSIKYALDRFSIEDEFGNSRAGWENCNYNKDPEHVNDAYDLYRMLEDSRLTLVNTIGNAIYDSKYHDKYKKQELVDAQNLIELGAIQNSDKKEKDIKAIDNGWIAPHFDESSYEFYYSPITNDKDGNTVDIKKAELADHTYCGFDMEKEKARLKADVEKDYRKREEEIARISAYYRGANFQELLNRFER